MQTPNTVMDYNDTPVKDLQHQPELRVVCIEEYQGYTEYVQSQCTSIRGVYLVNLSVVHHHCSAVPEYELEYLYSIAESDLSRQLHEQLMEDIEEGGSDSHPDIYMTQLPLIGSKWITTVPNLIDSEEIAEGQTIGELMKDVKEYLICNHPF